MVQVYDCLHVGDRMAKRLREETTCSNIVDASSSHQANRHDPRYDDTCIRDERLWSHEQDYHFREILTR